MEGIFDIYHSQSTSTHLTKIKPTSTHFNPLLPTSPIYQPLFTHETNIPNSPQSLVQSLYFPTPKLSMPSPTPKTLGPGFKTQHAVYNTYVNASFKRQNRPKKIMQGGMLPGSITRSLGPVSYTVHVMCDTQSLQMECIQCAMNALTSRICH